MQREVQFCHELNTRETVLAKLPKYERTFIGVPKNRTLAAFVAMGKPWHMIPGILEQQLNEKSVDLSSDLLSETVAMYQGLYPLNTEGEIGKPCYAT
jgi:hypothetical protein